jgi:Protein of unknown function (DUF1761)
MPFAGISYLAVLAAAAAGFGFGAAYYMTFGARWMHALGKTKEEIAGNRSPVPFIVAAVAQLVIAYMMAGLLGHLGDGSVTARNGLITGFFIWIGFVITTMAVNYGFQGAKPMLTVIDGAHWLGVLLLQGLVIGSIGV